MVKQVWRRGSRGQGKGRVASLPRPFLFDSKSSLRAKRSNPVQPRRPAGLPRRFAPRNDDQTLATSVVSTLRPGPMDELSDTFLTYLPLAPVGLARTMASTNASKLRRRSSFEKLALSIPDW